MAKAPAKNTKKKTFKKREKRNIPIGLVHVQATFNNTIITFTDRSETWSPGRVRVHLASAGPVRVLRSPRSRRR